MRLILAIFLTTLATFAILLFSTTEQWALDLLLAIQKHNNSGLIFFLQKATDSISFVSVGIPVLILLVSEIKMDKSNRGKVMIVLVCLALSGIASSTIKNIVKKPRPFVSDRRIEKLSGGGSYSFPSGHATEAATAAIAMIVTWRHWYTLGFYIVWSFLIMYSRMALGVHDLFDIVGGIELASGSVLLVLWLNSRIRLPKK